MKKAALIEIGGSHDECLYSQLAFLKSGGYETHLICSSNLEQQVADYTNADEKLFIDFIDKDIISNWKKLGQLRNYIVHNTITTVIFNTSEGAHIRNFTLLPFPHNIQFAGTIHNAKKLHGSFSQSIISRRVKKYFVLHDYLLQYIPAKMRAQCSSYYPIFFPNYPSVEHIDKKANDIWVCIPGQLEYKRRDYTALAKAIAETKTHLPLKFILLGKSKHRYGDGAAFENLVKELNIENYFVLWDGFIDNNTFYSYLQASDFIMPLIHKGAEGFDNYFKYQVSGSFNLAIAYKKPRQCLLSLMAMMILKTIHFSMS